MCRQSATVCLVKPPTLAGVAVLPLVERLRVLPDPRRRRGVRHPFVAVLLVAASAVVAGARSYAAIVQWSANAPQHTLARLGARTVGMLGVRVPPSAATIRRVLGRVCPGGPADLTGADPQGAQSLAVDGKAARGSRYEKTPAVHLLAAMTDQGRTVTQLRVPDKTSLTPMPGPTRQVAVDHREPAALRPRHRLQRGRLQDPHRPRARQHGHPAEPGDQHAPRRRTQQHRRWPPPCLLRTLHRPLDLLGIG